MSIAAHPKTGPKDFTLPNGDPFDVHQFRDHIDTTLALCKGRQDLVVDYLTDPVAKPTPYFQEAVKYRLFSTQEVSPEQRAALSAFGLDPQHPLTKFRQRLLQNACGLESLREESALLIWGASATSGSGLYREIGLLTRCHFLRVAIESYPEIFGSAGLADVLLEWVERSGVRKKKSLAAARRMIEQQTLNLHPGTPEDSFSKLDLSVVQFALSAADQDRRLAFFFFICLSRIAKYKQPDGLVRWRSSWLRGLKNDPYAIPGASSHEAALRRLLDDHVWDLAVDYLAGKKARTYRVKIPLPPGYYGPKEAAQFFGVELRTDGTPKPFRHRG